MRVVPHLLRMRLAEQKEALGLLKGYGIPAAKSHIYHDIRSAQQSLINFPLVLKLVSEKIVHKTEEKAVITGIQSRQELARHLADSEKRFRKRYPSEKLDFMLQEQLSGTEVIIGMKRDAQFGPVILFGMGGVLVEVFKDVSMRIAPLSKKDIKEMMEEIKGIKILRGFRGEKPVNIDALADMLSRISGMSVKEKDIAEIDFNPVIVNERHARVVDVRMLKDE